LQNRKNDRIPFHPVTSVASNSRILFTRYFHSSTNRFICVLFVSCRNFVLLINLLTIKVLVFEKEVVLWMKDSEASSCGSCGCQFSLRKRRHHCRLCGCVMCSSCSKFITFNFARKNSTLITAICFLYFLIRQLGIIILGILSLKGIHCFCRAGLYTLQIYRYPTNFIASFEILRSLRLCNDGLLVTF
uniref:FYVE-type domain-containing protein n=1 Tax=Soboliphyme baturini TaxID=241478 RepID=A0A183J827_9BILA